MTSSRTRAALPLLLALAVAPAASRAAGLQHLLDIHGDDKEVPLRAPEGVACSDKGALVVADTGNGRLLTFTLRDGKLGGGAPIRLAEATHPVRVEIDSRGNVLVLDRKTRRIVRVDGAGKFAGAVELAGAGAAVSVIAFKLDASDNLAVLDAAGRRVLLARPDGRVTRQLPWPESTELTDVAFDGGRLLVVDAVASRLWAAGKEAGALAPVGEGVKDRVSFPVYLSSGHGALRLVDQNGHGIALLGPDGSFRGRELSLGWTDGRVYYPGQVCLSGAGQLAVADRNNNRVQVFTDVR